MATWALPFVLGFAVLERSLTAGGLGVVLAARTVGFLVAVPVAGVLADRHPRRRVVAWSGAVAGLATPLLAVGLGRSVVLVAAAAAVVGAGQGACRPAFQALTAVVVAEERRRQANAAMTVAVRVTTLVAPGLTALLALFAITLSLVVVNLVFVNINSAEDQIYTQTSSDLRVLSQEISQSAAEAVAGVCGHEERHHNERAGQ